MLPKKRQPQSSGIKHYPERVYPRHRKFVRSHVCIIADQHECEGPIVFAHIRSAANSGISIKPGDWHGVSMCDKAHREQHQVGQPAFEVRYRLDLAKLAAEFAARTPDEKLREALRDS